jgi:hypothetical protein
MPRSGDGEGKQWSLLELLKGMQLDEASSAGASPAVVPGTEALHRRLLVLRPKLEAYTRSLLVRDLLPRLVREVEQAYAAWQQGTLNPQRSESFRAVSLLAAAEHMSKALQLCEELEEHTTPKPPAAGDLGRTRHFMLMAFDLLKKGWSLTGALREAFDQDNELRARAHGYLSRVIGVPPERLDEWTDAEERTYGEVLLALDRAIREIDQDTRRR